MKRFFSCVMLCMVSIISFAQLQTISTEDARGYKTVYKFWMGYGEIRYIDSAFVLMGVSSNQFENKMHSIILGETKDEAIQSLKDLENLKKQKSEGIIVIGFGQKETHIWKGAVQFDTQGIAGFSYALYYLKTDKAIEAVNNFDK